MESLISLSFRSFIMNPKQLFYIDAVHSKEPVIITESWWLNTLTHPLVTRMRHIRQMANTYLTFHGTNHTRYEHAASVGYLVSQFLPKNLENGVREKAIFSGLCHDIGHGPFSHSFEKFILPKIGVYDWKHEAMSEKLANSLYDDIGEVPFDGKDFKTIFNNGGREYKTEIFYLISNKASGFDLDRFDYMKRDSFYCGIQLPINWGRLARGITWIPDFNGKEYTMCFENECVNDLGDMLKSRYQLFESIYSHPRNLAIDVMIADLFVECEPIIGLRQKINDMHSFALLNDSLLPQLLALKDAPESVTKLSSRIRNEDLYDDCGRWKILNHSGKEKQSKSQLKEFEACLRTELKASLDHISRPDEIEIQFFVVNGLQDCYLDKILVRSPTGVVEYLGEQNADRSHFNSQRLHYFRVFSKTPGRKDDIEKAMDLFVQKNVHRFELLKNFEY
jgi:HD superfamily phosphohydrolase